MADLRGLLQGYVDDGSLPGAVGLVARGDQVEVAVAGSLAVGGAPMAADSIFRFASITKPIAAAAVMMLVEDGLLALDEPIRTWLPELAAPMVVRTPSSEIDDVVPAARPITVYDLLTSTAGYGFASDFSLPAVRRLFAVQRDGREVGSFPAADVWLAELAEVPMLYQPGEAYLYDTCSTLQGVLISRVAGRSLPDFLRERLFEPLGMVDTAFEVPAAERDRFTTLYRAGGDGGLEQADGPDGQWSGLPAFPLASAGLVGTARDWLAFGRMLLAGGVTGDGRRLLSAQSVRLMTSDHTTVAQRKVGELFLEGQGWGFGGSVDITPTEPWNIPGRYGWVGGTGTTAHLVPSTGTVAVLLTQVAMGNPTPDPWMRDFWRFSAGWEG
ncbi:serine hydrolase domain-containing protein [Nonomuraea gerenzanensis]|uniref:Beta-lactamase class C and other penicillin binding proteins n=1 Tax=Nonomuraea gerenzanensis TaxID=93944 RepID=A0A1M4EQ29_9ACTN|nr:serine hydrolase domain-containing protein [Nonomuraea gerenzanensis]UBU12381.1 beta-lactamase family protein [Nonomuraea gerenzanensis]SBP00930.1 Beta-lactamase class C and other penicillin binding proteins [Nonomuraea gerenzanensis]